MRKHLFNNLNPNFFNPLASPNKYVYVDCIFIIYDILDSVEAAFQGDREEIVQALIQYFEDKFDNQSGLEFGSATTPRQKAIFVINYFKECGWLGEEDLGDYKTSLNLFDYSIMIIEVLKSIQSGEQLEYSGEIYSVYALLKNFKVQEGVGILEQVAEQTKKITRRLKALNANIYRYYNNILENKSGADLKEILDNLLNEYKINFFDKAYYNLKTRDSLPRYKGKIIELINKIYNNQLTMTKLSEQTMDLKQIENFDNAYRYVEDVLRYVRDSFNAYDPLVREIDTRNEKYITTAASKILFYTKRGDDLEGIFNRIFKILLDSDEKTFDYTNLFNLVYARNLDEKSLHTQRVYQEDTSPDALLFNEIITDEIKRQKIQMMMKNNIYSKSEINKYALGLLGEKDRIEAAELNIESWEDIIKLVLIFLYSRSIGVSYTCELTTTEVRNNRLVFNNFYIIRRSKK